jgi:hypothetical protein
MRTTSTVFVTPDRPGMSENCLESRNQFSAIIGSRRDKACEAGPTDDGTGLGSLGRGISY